MTKEAWVLQLKPEVTKEDYEGKTLFLADDEDDFLTEELQKATLIHDKEKEIEVQKAHERTIFELYGPNAICNFGYTNISKNFDWVEVEVEENGMLNRTILVGRLTKDPDLRYTQSGVAVTNFTLAVNRPFKSQDGEQQADFINIQIWRKQAENAANYLKKGSLCGIDGRIQTRNYEGQDGKRVYVTEVIADSVQFLEPKRDGQAKSNYQASNQDDPFQGGSVDIQDDDLPF